MVLAERAHPVRVLVRVRTRRANAVAERFVGTIRRECLDRVLVLGRRQLELVLTEYFDHYNGHRPRRSLDQAAPLSALPVPPPTAPPNADRLRRSDRLGGPIHEYKLVV